jgi:hypothetical protein
LCNQWEDGKASAGHIVTKLRCPALEGQDQNCIQRRLFCQKTWLNQDEERADIMEISLFILILLTIVKKTLKNSFYTPTTNSLFWGRESYSFYMKSYTTTVNWSFLLDFIQSPKQTLAIFIKLKSDSRSLWVTWSLWLV